MHFADAKLRHWPQQDQNLDIGERSEPIVIMQVLAVDWSRNSQTTHALATLKFSLVMLSTCKEADLCPHS